MSRPNRDDHSTNWIERNESGIKIFERGITIPSTIRWRFLSFSRDKMKSLTLVNTDFSFYFLEICKGNINESVIVRWTLKINLGKLGCLRNQFNAKVDELNYYGLVGFVSLFSVAFYPDFPSNELKTLLAIFVRLLVGSFLFISTDD